MRDYACLPISILAETAGRQPKVVFSGEGGDETFAGYRRYHPRFSEHWVKGMVRPTTCKFRTRGQWSGHWVRRLFGPQLRSAAHADREPFPRTWRATPRDWSDMGRRQYTDLVTALPDNVVVKTDRMLMGFGLEGVSPFLDRRVVELGLSLPDGLKVRNHKGKWLLKHWAEPKLPAAHLRWSKRGFRVPVGNWLQGEVVEHLGERLLRNRGIREWFLAESIPGLVAARRARRGVSRQLWGCQLWGLMQFAIWHRLFIEEQWLAPSPDENPLDWIASES